MKMMLISHWDIHTKTITKNKQNVYKKVKSASYKDKTVVL